MRLDHLLSKEEKVRVLYTVESLSKPAQNGRTEKMGKLAFTDSMNGRDALEDFAKRLRKRSFVRWRAKDEQEYEKDERRDSGGDALRGNTRTHPEHEG